MTSKTDINAADESQPSEEARPESSVDLPQHLAQASLWRRLGSAFSKAIYRLNRIFGELTAVVLGLGIAGLWMASSALESQSTDLTVLRPNIKLWFADAFDGRDAEFGQLEVTWLPTNNHFVFSVADAEIRGPEGEILEKFEKIQSTFAPNLEAWSRPRLVNARVKGGVLTYLEDIDGRIIAGLGPPNAVGRVGPVYRSEDPKRVAIDMTSMLKGLEYIQIENARVFVKNDRAGVDMVSNVDLVNANFSKNGNFALTATGTVDQTSAPMPFTLDTISDANFDSVKLKLKVTGARLDELAPAKGRFWEFQGMAAPMDVSADIDFSRSMGLRAASVDVKISPGHFTLLRHLDRLKYPIQSLVARASLAPGEQRMDVELLDLQAPNLSFKSSGYLTELDNLSDGDPNSSPVFNLFFRDIRTNMTPLFSTETNVKGLELVGQADVDSRSLKISRGKLSVFDTVHDFDGALTLQENNELRSLHLKSEMRGAFKPDQLMSLWPVKSYPGARAWIEGALLDADVTELGTEIAFTEDFFENPVLTADRFKLHFGGTSATVRYMQTLPPATGLQARGAIIGNHLGLDIEAGQVGAINLTGGTVEIPRLLPRNGDVIITVDGQGSMSEFMRLADHPPFQVAQRYNVDPNSLTGAGDVTVKITRALTPGLPRDQVDHHITGTFTGANAPFDLGKYKISDGVIAIDANTKKVSISGPVNIGPWRADMRWLETFGENAPLTQYGVSGMIDADILDQLGLASRTWFDGQASVRVDAEGLGMDIVRANLAIDLTNSELSMDRIWMKSAGEPASLTGQLTRGSDSSYIVENLNLMGGGIGLSGRLSLEPDYKLREIDLSQVSIPSLIEGAVKITPDRVAGRLGLELDASFLDVSPWTEDLLEERQSNLDVPLTLQGRVASLILDENYPVTDSQILFSHSGEVIETARLEALSDGAPLKLELSTRADRKRQLTIEVPDASKAVSAFLGLGNTTGGKLEITANLPAAGEEGAHVGEAQMRDFKINEAPALAQLLSLASLTGLSDALTSGSMQFDRFKLPFTILDDDISIRDARLYGPALGMTGDGDIDLGSRVLDFDGTLVPSYSANSFLADIPLLGDILVREKDGGVFALTYTVTGPFEQTQIAVNPLSALTPGFLRGIFKPDRSEIDEAMREAIADVQPKIEKKL